MGAVDDYLESLPVGAQRTELERLHRLILELQPGLGQATSYRMACYTHRGKPVAALVANKAHLGWYPYSGAVLPELDGQLERFSRTDGALRFQPEDALGRELVAALLGTRVRHIDQQLDAPKRVR